ncbi:hypothetical protein AMJ85_03330 [candidate division BRC1 bacterium SM23_51]|nr:MAG: hypothetical protein AMJ85_03330 [candidate division BRC1 bacterium SM23_51]
MKYIRVGRVEDFPANSCQVISLPDGEPVVVINLEDELHVLEGRCSHGGHSLERTTIVESEDKVLCPWHGWEIDLERGVCLAAPDHVLKKYPVRLEAGEVLIGR